MSEIPDVLSRAYCPKCGDVTGATWVGVGVHGPGESPEPREWCRCGWAVERVRYVREQA